MRSACARVARTAGALGTVEGAELDATFVRGQRHGTAQRVHLFDQMALANAANAGVAAHLPQGLDVVGEQQGFAAHAGSGQGGLGASMATADNDHIKFLGYNMGGLRGPAGPNQQNTRARFALQAGRKASAVHQARLRVTPIFPLCALCVWATLCFT